jgi:hypothetical protein
MGIKHALTGISDELLRITMALSRITVNAIFDEPGLPTKGVDINELCSRSCSLDQASHANVNFVLMFHHVLYQPISLQLR